VPDVQIRQALQWLDAHTNLETGGGVRRPTLERIGRLVELLGSPQRDFPVIHVTGTNGKTTTTRTVAHLLTARGLSVGAYTSPHLERVNERIAWAGEAVGDEALAEGLSAVAAVEALLPGPPSYFEILTAAAYRLFADWAVDVAAVEVGLGGTWDATNVADGAVAVVTNVSIDHTEYLGPTRASIAAEKAGIIKPGATLVLGETDLELEKIFLERRPGRVLRRGVDFAVVANRPAHGGRVVDVLTPAAEYRDLYMPLHGRFQADNAAIALATAEAFFAAPLEAELVAGAFASFRTPGRLEVVSHQPLVVLDGAHNVAGAEALRAALDEEFVPGPRTFVVGLLREKDPVLMLDALGAGDAAHVVACPPPSPRALDPRLVGAAALELGVDPSGVELADTVAEGVARALAVTAPDGQVIVAGSLYLVGDARSALAGHTTN
jgi:dihydrofolate synthase / folylpolyglutamate synthase